MADSERTRERKTGVLEWLKDPWKSRLAVTGAIVLIGYLAVYMPLSNQIADTQRKQAKAQRRLELARDIEQLQAQFDRFKDRVPTDADTNEWIQFLLAGVRLLPLTLNQMDTAPPQAVGPYRAVTLRIEVEGKFHDLDRFLHWLESNERLFRVDSMKIVPSRTDKSTLVMQLTVLGVTA
jgi:Tfp pilus assembly protein PilO